MLSIYLLSMYNSSDHFVWNFHVFVSSFCSQYVPNNLTNILCCSLNVGDNNVCSMVYSYFVDFTFQFESDNSPFIISRGAK